MHGWDYLDASDWFWVTVMMTSWIVLLGLGVSIAVKLARGGNERKSR